MRFGALVIVSALLGCPRASTIEPAPLPKRPASAAITLPGPCVDPAADARASFGPDADAASLRVDRTVDLDGDGVLDPFVTHPAFCGTGGCDFRLYVTRGSCAHRVGALFGSEPSPGKQRSHGLVDLETAARNGCGGLARTEVRARFDGATYAPYAERTCPCPDEGASSPEPDCEPWKPPASK